MDSITTVIIRYDIKNRITYQKFAEFFRLVGIYVWEQCDVYRQSSEGEIEVEEDSIESEDTLICNIDSLVSKVEDNINTWDCWRKLLNIFICENENMLQGTELEEALLVLKEIYTNDFFVAVATVQYYRMGDSLVSEAGKMFRQAINNIETKSVEDLSLESNRYVRYALLYCYQKVNLVSILCDEPVIEFVDVLANRCLQLVMDYPGFSNAWALLGKIYEVSKGKTSEAINAYEQAVKLQGNYPYVSSIYYWIGKRCEGYPNWRDVLQEAYTKAYQLEQKYRIVYKIAMLEEQKESWQVAIQYFKKCLELIQRKGNDLDPLEQEYVYKLSIRIGYIYMERLEQPYESIYWFEVAECFRNNIADNRMQNNPFTKFYHDLYANEASKYIALELKRMRTNQLHVYMVEAYRQANQTEKELEYRKILVQEERE